MKLPAPSRLLQRARSLPAAGGSELALRATRQKQVEKEEATAEANSGSVSLLEAGATPKVINVTENVTAARGPLNFTWSPPPPPMSKAEFKRLFRNMKHNRANSRRKRRNRTIRFRDQLTRMMSDDGAGANDTILWKGMEGFHKEGLKLKSEYWTNLCNSTGVKNATESKQYREKVHVWEEFCVFINGVTILSFKDMPVVSDAKGALAWKSEKELANTDLSSLVNKSSSMLRNDVKLSLEVMVDDSNIYPTTFEYCAEPGDKGISVALPAPEGGWVRRTWETLVVELPESAYKSAKSTPWKKMTRLVLHTNAKGLTAAANAHIHFKNVRLSVA